MSTVFRRAPALWQVTGHLRAEGRPRQYRTVVVVASGFREAAMCAADALLHNWSNKPHVVEVVSVVAFSIKDQETECSLLWPENVE